MFPMGSVIHVFVKNRISGYNSKQICDEEKANVGTDQD